jgi:isocitrate dehydrogenase
VAYEKLVEPKSGNKIQIQGGKVQTPDDPIIPYVEGDGIGRDITKATQRIVNAGVAKAYGEKHKIHWWKFTVIAQEKWAAIA